jgi:hypothetical protein
MVEAFFVQRLKGNMMQKKYSDHSRDGDSLRVACTREGCPICTVVLESMNKVMDNWNYEGFTDVAHRHELIRTHGFCPLHTWQLAQRSNTFQLAVVYREILTEILKNFDQETDGKHGQAPTQGHTTGWFGKVQRWLQTDAAQSSSPVAIAMLYEHCPLCRSRADIELRIVQTLVEVISSEEAQQLLRQSTGLCRPHFMQANNYAKQHAPGSEQVIADCQRACLQRTLAEIEELVRKHDYRYLDEARGDEMTSWRRAAQLCAGNPGMW